MIGFETTGNATLTLFDDFPVLSTDPWIYGNPYFGSWGHRFKLPPEQLNNIKKANLAIVIADKIEPDKLRKIKNNCFIIHRLDEHVENNETGFRKEKHEKIKKLNQLADVTVYQSKFVFENMHPYLGSPSKYEIIYNGGMQDEFYPSESYGKFIGHVTWGVDGKKRLDVLYNIIRTYNMIDGTTIFVNDNVTFNNNDVYRKQLT